MFKIRASKASDIAHFIGGITEKQLETLTQLEAKAKRTEKQEATLLELKAKRDTPPALSVTAKTYCEEWLKEQLYSKKKEFSNKYTEKGIITEDDSLDFIADKLELGMLFKNEEFLQDEFMCGTPDVIAKDIVIDVKNSWDCFTFPLFKKYIPTDDYYWQAQVYMHLTGKTAYKLIYVLSDTPIHLIEREAKSWAWNNGYGEVDDDLLNKFIEKYTYPHIDSDLKIKVYDIAYNKNDIEKLQKAVKLCREYIDELVKSLPEKFKDVCKQ